MGETAEALQAGMAMAPDAACRIACDALARIGIPQLRAGLAPIRSLTLTCEAGADLPALVLALTAEPPLLRAEPLRIPGLEAGASRACAPPAMTLEEAALDALQAVTACVLTLVTTVEGRPVGRATVSLDLLPATYWAGIETAPDALATFVRPGDPAIDALLARAAEHLPPGHDRLATYADGRARVWETAQAIHAALRDQALRDQVLAESAPVAGAEPMRSPGAVLGDGWAGPLDRALILAACFERAGLDALLVLGASTVAAGLRLVDARPAETVDTQGLRKHRDLDELILIATGPAAFPEALAAGARMVEAGAALDLALDLRTARLRGLAPLTPEAAGAPRRPPRGAYPRAPTPAFAEDRPPAIPPRPAEARPRDRLEAWKLRLLDLTLRNKLLNFRPGKASLSLCVPDPDALAALLVEGAAIRLLPKPEVLRQEGPEAGDALRREAARSGEIATHASADDLDTRLTDLFRLARTALEEGGTNVLHLAVGFLSWTRGGTMAPVRAPLLLVPVALTRASVRAGFRLVRHDAEVRVNPTLIEMLRQDFGLTLPDLDAASSGDGLDVSGLWRIVRGHVRDLKGFEVETDVVLSTFAFTKVLMWRDLAERTDLLKRNPVVRHLLDTPTLAYGDTTGFPAPERLDAAHPPQTVFTPLPADSSQLCAILAAGAGKDFVLLGPPGTGKSQTIANIIAHALALGRTVLFVSQKAAALDVVRRRLDAAGLGACCLEVHAARAQKAHVLAQLREAWAARGPETVPWYEAGADLERRRAALNDVVARLHAPRANGLSAQAAFGRLIAARAAGALRLALSWPDHAAHTPETLAGLRARAAALAALLPLVGDPASHPLRGIGPADWSPLWRAEMERALADLAGTLPAFGAAADRLGGALGLPGASETWAGTRALLALASGLARPEAAAGLRCLAADAGSLRQAVEARRQHEAALARAAARLHGRYAEALFATDLSATRDAWRAAQGANLLVRGARLRRLRRMLEADALAPLPEDLGPDLATLLEIQRLRAAGPALAGTLEAAFAGFGPPWNRPDGPAEAFAAPLAWAVRMAPALAALAGDGAGVEALRRCCLDRLTPGGGGVDVAVAEARAALSPLRLPALRAIETLGRLAARPHPDRPLATGPGWVAGTLDEAARWASALPKAQVWLRWQGAVQAAREAGLGPLVAAVEAGALGPDAIPEALERAYAGWWIDHVVTHDPVLRGFQGPDHEAAIEAFRAADARVCALAGATARARLGGVPSPVAFGQQAEWGLLAREIAKRGRHLALRQLFARLPGALTRLTPCVMMSPLSVAQHWPAEAPPFDLVIFDEASQIAPWDAIGAIARGRRTVIVGDPEQLPPTSVGEREGDADDLDVPDQESILDECLAAHLPRHRLAWHYRSRHESLIAFSNRHYYRGGLITFPSPVTSDRAVRLVPVADGLYERGAARVNRPEARAVVAEVLARLRADAESGSLGIVTFNGEQQRLIENLLDAERRADPDLERHFDARLTPEPVFVKNLETVQGDERDAILFSVAVGPDGAGRITGQVSSLNRSGGHRRLNVAITRARRELLVFTSLRPEQIDLGRGAARGIRDFKHFLEFAAHGASALETAAAPTGRDVESPFEASVMAALEARGWRVVPQVGVAAFRIDLGIVHPDAPGRYLAGVECDGASYHSAATARDRDRLRHGVLTDLGWRLHRVWSTDWWIDADGALDRLDAGLRADLESDRAKPELEPEPPPEAAPPSSSVAADTAGFALDASRLHAPDYDAVLDALVAHVIAREGPLFADRLVARVARAHGINRTTARLRARILSRVGAEVPRAWEDARELLWPVGVDPQAPVPFRPATGEPRDPADIPLAELAGLAAQLGGAPGDLPARMARHLGVARPRAALARRLARAAAQAHPDPEAAAV